VQAALTGPASYDTAKRQPPSHPPRTIGFNPNFPAVGAGLLPGRPLTHDKVSVDVFSPSTTMRLVHLRRNAHACLQTSHTPSARNEAVDTRVCIPIEPRPTKKETHRPLALKLRPVDVRSTAKAMHPLTVPLVAQP
jgi:hypothetical protein